MRKGDDFSSFPRLMLIQEWLGNKGNLEAKKMSPLRLQKMNQNHSIFGLFTQRIQNMQTSHSAVRSH